GGVVRGPCPPVLDRLEHGLERGDRGPQVVARPRHELPPGVEQLLEPRGHLVERGRDLRELRRPAPAHPGGESDARPPRPVDARSSPSGREIERVTSKAPPIATTDEATATAISTASACMSNITMP